MTLHTLLLNSTYEPISFVNDRKVFKLLINEKVEVISVFEDAEINWGSRKIHHPAVIKLNHHVRWIPKKMRFNRTGIFKRDQFVCLYCNKALTSSEVTIDHVIPRSRGGNNSWRNCVTACFKCNNKKGNRTLGEVGMKLLRIPTVPTLSIVHEFQAIKNQHETWKSFLGLP